MKHPLTRFVIVGGGLAGVYAAYLLEQQGILDYVLLEARDALGGRIQSLPLQKQSHTVSAEVLDRFDLGPTWFWPAFQPELDQLVTDLGIERFAQFDAGDMVFERAIDAQPVRTSGYVNSPPSMRLIGGMASLVDALRSRLTGGKILTQHQVRELRCQSRSVDVVSVDAAGSIHTVPAGQVLLAVPPRLALEHIRFSPALPAALAHQWGKTGTWMAPHAKYVAVYDTPFWREHGLSGEARSACGPLGEIHDASMPGGSAALFGFLGLPAAVRRSVSEDVLLAHCRAQLARLFGPQAAKPKAEFIKDWAQDLFTATPADLSVPAGHALAPASTAAQCEWQGRMVGVASEWSPQFSGYIAGAIESARLGVQLSLQTAAEDG